MIPPSFEDNGTEQPIPAPSGSQPEARSVIAIQGRAAGNLSNTYRADPAKWLAERLAEVGK